MSSQKEKIDALTGVRALAALWVVFLHFGDDFKTLFTPLGHIEWLTGKGRFGVDIFFILSGFILSYTYQKSIKEMTWHAYSKFVWFRFARIYPAYLVALAGAVAIVVVAILFRLPWNPVSYQLKQLFLELFMIQQWTFQDSNGWNYPDWSVSAEWFAYLFIFPMSYALLKRVGRPWIAALLSILCLATYSLAAVPDHSRGSWSLFQVSLEFLAGALLYKFALLTPQIKISTQNFLALITLAVIFALLWSNLDHGFERLSLLVALAVSLFLLKCNGGFLSVMLGTGVMVYLGEISYSIYLTHGIDQRILKVIFPIERYVHYSAVHRAAIFLIFLGMIIGGASLLYHLVEVPARNWLRTLSVKRDHKKI